MKTNVTLFVFAILLLNNCSPSPSTGGESTAETPTDNGPILSTFCLWGELGVREAAGDKAKYLSSIYLGEQVTLTSDSAVDGTHTWNKITMSDGKSGWVRGDFLGKNKLAAATTRETRVYKRPDLATITDQTFPAIEFLAADPAVNGWVHIKGKISGQKWFTEGFIQESALTFDKTEAEFAALYKRMSETENETVRGAIMSQLETTTEFQTISFYSMVFGEGDYEEVPVDEPETAVAQGPPYSTDDVQDLQGDGEGKIVNIYGHSDYWYVYKGRRYELVETSAETILNTVLFYHCTEDYLNSLPKEDKYIDLIPLHGYVPN